MWKGKNHVKSMPLRLIKIVTKPKPKKNSAERIAQSAFAKSVIKNSVLKLQNTLVDKPHQSRW